MHLIDFTLPVGICVITGESVRTSDDCMVYLNTTEGVKLFRVWIKPEYRFLKACDRKSLIQNTLGKEIDIKNLNS